MFWLTYQRKILTNPSRMSLRVLRQRWRILAKTWKGDQRNKRRSCRLASDLDKSRIQDRRFPLIRASIVLKGFPCMLDPPVSLRYLTAVLGVSRYCTSILIQSFQHQLIKASPRALPILDRSTMKSVSLHPGDQAFETCIHLTRNASLSRDF